METLRLGLTKTVAVKESDNNIVFQDLADGEMVIIPFSDIPQLIQFLQNQIKEG